MQATRADITICMRGSAPTWASSSALEMTIFHVRGLSDAAVRSTRSCTRRPAAAPGSSSSAAGTRCVAASTAARQGGHVNSMFRLRSGCCTFIL